MQRAARCVNALPDAHGRLHISFATVRYSPGFSLTHTTHRITYHHMHLLLILTPYRLRIFRAYMPVLHPAVACRYSTLTRHPPHLPPRAALRTATNVCAFGRDLDTSSGWTIYSTGYCHTASLHCRTPTHASTRLPHLRARNHTFARFAHIPTPSRHRFTAPFAQLPPTSAYRYGCAGFPPSSSVCRL